MHGTAPPADSVQNNVRAFLDAAYYAVPLILLHQKKVLFHGFSTLFRKSKLGMGPNVHMSEAEYIHMNPLFLPNFTESSMS